MFWLRFPSFFCLKGFSDLIFWAWEGRKIWLYPNLRMDEFPKVFSLLHQTLFQKM